MLFYCFISGLEDIFKTLCLINVPNKPPYWNIWLENYQSPYATNVVMQK